MPDMIGSRLGSYEIVALLGKGGMAEVYRARQRLGGGVGRDVALKLIDVRLSTLPEFTSRFHREAETLVKLSHPHILKAFDFGEQGASVYLVMELMTGGSLAELIQRASPLPFDKIAQLLDQISAALDYAHETSVIHRDLKPHNVLLDSKGNAFLTDFGIVKLARETTALTHSNVAIGTPSYMAPEQWLNNAIDARADLYSLGVMLFEMVAGRVPFQGDTPYRVMHLHANEMPSSIRSLRPDAPAALDRVIHKAMAKDPTARYESAAAMTADFKAAINGRPVKAPPILVAPPRARTPLPMNKPDKTPLYVTPASAAGQDMPPAARSPQRVQWLAIGAVLIVILAIGVIIGSQMGSRAPVIPTTAPPIPTTTSSVPLIVVLSTIQSPTSTAALTNTAPAATDTAIPPTLVPSDMAPAFTDTPVLTPSNTPTALIVVSTDIPATVLVGTQIAREALTRSAFGTENAILSSETPAATDTLTPDAAGSAQALQTTATAQSLLTAISGLTLTAAFETDTYTPTPIPPTATDTPTFTTTAVPPTVTDTSTLTLIPPTETPVPSFTPVPATITDTPSFTPLPPTATSTPSFTLPPPTLTDTPTTIPTDTPVPSNTPIPSNTPVPSDTPVPPTDTPSFTPPPPIATNTPGALPISVGNVVNLQAAQVFPKVGGTIGRMAFSAGGKYLLFSLNDGTDTTLRQIDLAQNQIESACQIANAKFSLSGSTVALVDSDQALDIQAIGDCQTGTTLKGVSSPVLDLSFSPGGTLLITSHQDGTVRIWTVATGQVRSAYRAGAAIVNLALDPLGELLVGTTGGGSVLIWDVANDQPVTSFASHMVKLSAPAVTSDGTIAVGGANGTLQLWNSHGVAGPTLKGHTGTVNAVAFNFYGSILASASDDKTVLFWNTVSGQLLSRLTLTARATGVAFSADGTLLAVSTSDGDIQLWTVRQG